MRKNPLLVILILTFLTPITAQAKTCTGRMVNPITDICWACVLPITIGAAPVVPGRTSDTLNFPSPVCVCPAPPPLFVRIGVAVGYWEPIRLIDVTKSPFCFYPY